MKKALAILLAAAALFASVNSNAQDKWVLNHVGIGVSAGVDGLGADLILPVSPFFQIRGGYNTLSILPKGMKTFSATRRTMSTTVFLSSEDAVISKKTSSSAPSLS